MKQHVDVGCGVVAVHPSGLDFSDHVVGTVQCVPHKKLKQGHSQQNSTAHQQHCHIGIWAWLACLPTINLCVSVGTLVAQFRKDHEVGEVFYDGMVLDWMLLFFKQLTTNQYMDQGELYQQNWCSIVGGVLDWMLFFSKH